jgi:hypothetical protein
MGMVSRGWDLGEVSWGSSASEAFVITESTKRRAPKPGVFSLNTTLTDVVMWRLFGL